MIITTLMCAYILISYYYGLLLPADIIGACLLVGDRMEKRKGECGEEASVHTKCIAIYFKKSKAVKSLFDLLCFIILLKANYFKKYYCSC
jgi:hypothetical protein